MVMTETGLAPQPAERDQIAEFAQVFEAIVDNVTKVVKGKEAAVRMAMVCVAAEGHVLLEDVPGVGKTTLAKSIAQSMDLEWRRIQFTPDLLPSDVTGANVYDRASATFEFRPGGIFTNVLLGDEINRASPKTQSALLEGMEEYQVTVDTTSYALPRPFLVIGTQNPIGHDGTYRLPVSQLDRFMVRLRVGYPDRRAEVAMLERESTGKVTGPLRAVADADTVLNMIMSASRVHVAPVLKNYIVELAVATRNHPALSLGASPRAVLSLMRAARALAASMGRNYVVPEDIKSLSSSLWEHRMVLSADASFGGFQVHDVLQEVVRSVPVPSGRIGS
jgi:MoxR-like ATPase